MDRALFFHLVRRDDFIERWIVHDPIHQREVHGVSGAFRNHVTQKRLADQSQIADQVQRLMPAAFIGKPQTARVKYGRPVKTSRVVE